MANVFIFTVNNEAAQRRFNIAFKKGYDTGEILPFIHDESHRDVVQKLYSDRTCYLWGEADKKDGARSAWERMKEGDLVLGYKGNAIISVSHVLYTINDSSLADQIWGQENGNSLRCIFFMTKPYLCDIAIVPQMHNYLDPPYKGLTQLGAEKLHNILAHYISLDDFARLLFGQDFPASLRHSQ